MCLFDQLVLTRTSMRAQILQWGIRDTRRRMGSRSVDYESSSHPSVTVGTTEFLFSLISPSMTLPHISQLQAGNVANGTMISCSVS